MIKKPFEFFDLFSSIGKDFEDRKDKIRRYYKVCSRCGQLKMLSEFNPDKRSLDDRTSACKVCRSEQSLSYYYLYREKILLQIKEYQSTHKKERSKYFEKYRIDHKKHLQKIAHSWYWKNRKRIKERDLKRKAKLIKGG